MSTSFKRLGQSELLPRYIFAESLYARRRVLEIGAVASTLGQSARFLSTRGARVVVAADADLQAIQEAQSKLAGPNLRFRPPVFDDFEAGSFDLVMVADLAPYVRAPELLKDLARLVAKTGYLMGGLRNPAGLALATVVDPEESEPPPTYGQLLDALSVHFTSVEVATQSPVLGYQLAFERGEGLQVDGSLAGNSEAAYFIIVAGQEPARTFDPTWVQLPPEPLAFTGGKLEDFSTRARDWRERSERLKEALQKKTVELDTRQADLREVTQQLEGAKEGVARLTAQLESQRDRPESLRDREELAQRVRRLEAELTVLRERAIDAEGRATAARNELEAVLRAQKDAAIGALAAQEQIRLERARREEVATQLEDARTRLARAYEELKKAQEDGVTERLERERALSQADRVKETLSSKETELAAARQRELALADARTQSLQAIEGLERSLQDARTQIAALRDETGQREAERHSLARSYEVESEQRRELERVVQQRTARVVELEAALTAEQTRATGFETELQAAASAHARALRDIETLASSERTWREMAGQFEQRLGETNANVQQLSDQIAQVSAEREAEVARARRLERDLETALTAERNTREQADVLAAGLRQQLAEVESDRDKLIEARTDLQGAVDDLRKAREAEQVRLNALEDQKATLIGSVERLEGELAEGRRVREEGERAAESKQRSFEATLAERDSSLSVERATTSALRQQIVGLDGEVARFGGMLRDGQRVLDETRGELDARTKQLNGEREAAQALGIKLEQTTAALETNRAEKAALQQRTEELSARIAALSEQVQNLQRVALAADEAIAAGRSKRAELDRELTGLREQTETDRRTASERAQALERELANERDAVAAAGLAANSVQQSLAAVTAERAQQASELVQLKEQLAAAERRGEALERDVTETKSSLSERTGSLEASQAAVTELKTQLRDTVEQLRQHQTSGEQLTQTVRARNERLVELEAQLSTSHSEVERQAARISELSAAAAASTDEGQRQAKRADEAETNARNVATELDQSKQQVNELNAALETARGEKASLASEFDTTKHALHLATLEAEHLKAELEEAWLSREQQQAQLTASETLTTEQRQALDEAKATLDAAKESHRREIEATTAAASKALEARQLELEGQLAALRDEHAKALENQAEAYRANLEQRSAEAAKTLASREDELMQRAAAAEAKANDLDRQRDELRVELTTARGATEQARADDKQHADAAATELEQVRAHAEAESKVLQSAKQALQQDLERAREELDQLRTSLAQAGGETRAIAEARVQLEAELERLRQRVPVLESDLEQTKAIAAEVQTLRERVPSLEHTISTLTQELSATESSRAQLAMTNATSETELTAFAAKVATLTATQEAQSKELADSQARVLDAEGRAANAMESLSRVQDERPAIDAEVSELRLKVSVLEKQLAEVSRAAPKTDAEMESLRRRLPELEAQLELDKVNARNDIEAAVGARRQAEELLLALRVKYGDLQHELASSAETIEQLKKGAPDLREQVAELTAENELLDSERSRLAEKVDALEKAQTDGAALRDRVFRLETDLELTRRLLDQARREADDARKPAPPVATIPPPNEFDDDDDPVTAVGKIPQLAELLKQTAPRAPAPPKSPPVPSAEPEVFELDIDEDDDAEEIMVLDEEAGAGKKGDGKK